MQSASRPTVSLPTHCLDEDHDLADPFRRAYRFLFRGIQRFDYRSERRTRVLAVMELWTCSACGTTRALVVMHSEEPLADEWCAPTDVVDCTETTSCPLTEERDPRNREGYVGVAL